MDKSGTSHIARTLRGEGPLDSASLVRGFCIGEWRVRPERCLLERGEHTVTLEPKIMGVLLCLAQRSPGVVTREQLIDEVWSGRVVSDEVLSRAISQLRSGLEDDPQEPRFIRTIPRVGYQLIPSVGRIEPPPAVGAGQALRRRRAQIGAMAAAVALVAGISAWWIARPDRDAGDASPVRLAILPLEFLGTEANDRYIADGLTEELTVNLARVNGLRVVARQSVQGIVGTDADLREIAHTLGSTHVVTGSVRADGTRLRVTMHLADSATGTELWADSYDRGLNDLFGVQAEIANAVTQALRERLPAAPAGGDSAGRLVKPPADAAAYRLFLQGRQQLARRGEDGIRAAITLFGEAVDADPGFLRARLALAYSHSLLANAVPAEASLALARADQELARVARQTAMSGDVHAVRAVLELERNRWSEAAEAFRAALAATPDDTELRLLHSQLLGATADRAGALREAQAALANDPLSPAANLRLAVLRLWADRDAEAARHLATARELGLASTAAPELQLLLLVRQQRFDQLREALDAMQRRRGQSGDWVPAVVAAIEDPHHGPAALAAIEQAAASGQIDELLELGALVLARQHDRALQWLLSRPRLRTLEVEFLWSREAADLRRLPGFAAVLSRFGLDQYWDRAGWPAACSRAAGTISCR